MVGAYPVLAMVLAMGISFLFLLLFGYEVGLCLLSELPRPLRGAVIVLASVGNGYIGWIFGRRVAKELIAKGREASPGRHYLMGGLFVGLLTGTVITPVIGTVIGLVLGMVIGAIGGGVIEILVVLIGLGIKSYRRVMESE